MNRSSFCSIIP